MVEERLCCCINILHSHSSIYEWKGKIEEEEEWVLIGKTTSDSGVVESFIRKHHPYQLPAIIFLKVEKVNKDYLEWCSK